MALDEAIATVVALLAPRLGWSTWTWFTRPTAWLSGEIPAEVIRENPQRVIAAARRFSNLQEKEVREK